jgi:prophage DNA circulation protein
MPPLIKFDSSFGDVPFLVTSISTERGRDVVVHSPAQGSKHTLAAQGKRLRRATCEIKFIDQPGQAPYDERYQALVKLFEGDETRIFVHPLDGSYPAQIAELDVTSDASALEIVATVVFLHEQNEKPVLDPAAGINTLAGVEAVSVAVDRATSVLDEFELESSVLPDVKSTVEAWGDATNLDSQEVFLGVSSLTQQIDAEIVRLELLKSNETWTAYREMILLRYELVRAAQAFTSNAPTLIEIFVEQPSPVMAIAAELYGGALAQQRRDEIVKLNRIRTPARVPAGTRLKVPAP